VTTPADDVSADEVRAAAPSPPDVPAPEALLDDAAAPTSGTKDQPASGSRGIAFDPRSVARSTLIVLAMIAGFLLALWLYGVIGHFLFLLLLAWLLAASMEPAIGWLTAHGRKRGTAAAITGGLGILALLVLVAVFGDLLVQQVSSIVGKLPAFVTTAIDWLNQRFNLGLDPSTFLGSINLQPGQASGAASSIAGGVFGIVDSAASILLDLVTVLVFGFYIAAAGPHFLQSIARGLRPDAQRVFVQVASITAQKTGGYVVSKVILAALSALFHGILFAAIGVPNWLPYALLVGITAQFVPLVGTYIGVLLPVLATVFDAPWKAVVIILFAAVYQQIESYVFTPRVSKRTMDVNPAVALAAVFLGAAIWGPIGALIGIPLTAAGFAVAETFSRRYELIPELADDAGAPPDPVAS
jgi:predicted PurR-regulated permease PerM